MYQALKPGGGAFHRGYMFEKYPSSFSDNEGKFFKYEIVNGEVSKTDSAIIEGMEGEARTMRVKTAYNIGWKVGQYIATEGEMFVIKSITEKRNNASMAMSLRSSFEISLYGVKNPIAL